MVIKIQIRKTSVEMTDVLRMHLERRLRLALSRFADRIGTVIVRLSHAAPERSGSYKRCQIEVGLRPHRVQAEELDSRRQRVESEIDTMRARVDPDRLVATLRSVRAKYEGSIAEGEALLDDLIDDLRRAARAPAGAAAE